MLRMHLVVLLGLLLVGASQGDEPKPSTSPKPPWQRLLTGADAKMAANLDKQIEALQAADKYPEAIRLNEELLALRIRVQGADYWQTVDEKWALLAMKKVAALSAEKRLAWRKAEDGAVEAETLMQKAQYAKALPLRQERLKWCREVLGEDHPDTATSYNNVAETLYMQGKHVEAETLFQKGLDIRRRVLGEEHPSTAAGYNDFAANLNAQGKYPEAGTLFQKALDIKRKALGEEDAQIATSYNNVASNLTTQGKYNEAGPLYQKALDIQRKLLGENHEETAITYNNLAYNLKSQGKNGEAGPLFQKSLDIFRKIRGEDHPDTATGYNNVAENLDDQGKNGETGLLYQKALDIKRKVLGEDNPLTAIGYDNVAFNLYALGKYAEAAPLYQKALDIRLKMLGEEHPTTAKSYNNVGFNLHAQKKYAEAEVLFQKALDIERNRLGEDHPVRAMSYNNLAFIRKAQGKNGEAGLLYQKALDIRRKALGENHALTVASYNYLAFNLQHLGKYPEALAALETTARSYEAARLEVAAGGLERADFGARQSPYPFLATARLQAGRPSDAWAALEADLARGLLDEMGLRREFGLSPEEQRRQGDLRARRVPLDSRIFALATKAQRTDAESTELDQLVAQRQQLEKSLTELAVLVSQRAVAPLAEVQASLPADAAVVAWVDVTDRSGTTQEHWGCVVRSRGEPHWERLPGSGPEGKWTSADTELPGLFHAALAQSATAAAVDALAKKLHAQRLAPLIKHLDGVKHLLVAPVHKMAGIPIEALTDEYTISYIPSCTYLARLKERQRPQSNGLLAVGDPVFPPVKAGQPPPLALLPPGGLLITQVVPGGNAANANLQAGDVLVTYAGQDLTSLEQLPKFVAAHATEKTIVVKVWREGQEKLTERELAPGRLGIVLAKEPAREALASRRQADQMLAQLTRGESHAELPGTQVEIARLAELFNPKSVTTLTRAAASEQRLDELRQADKLKQFRYLHFATHGQANNVRTFESALLLTPPVRLPEVRVGEPYIEGRLTAGEVLTYWQLDADLVTLSACESGLGKGGGGDGLLGFAQAFLKAGSRSVCLTLWQVDDTATALLMDRFYRNLLGKRPNGGKPMSKAAALREAKQWLRTLTASEALERLGTLTQGVVRGERPLRQEMQAVPKPKDAGKDYRPYEHPRYWAAFILIGDPE